MMHINIYIFIILLQYYIILVFLLNRTKPNFWSGSGSVHQISVWVRVRVWFIKSRFGFGFGSSNLGSGSVRFNHVMLYFISKKSITIALGKRVFLICELYVHINIHIVRISKKHWCIN